MEFLFVVLMILITATTLTTLLKKRIEQTIPIAVVGIILIIYITGLFDHLEIGVILVEIINFLQIPFLIYTFVSKANQRKEWLKIIFTPGLFIYLTLFIASIFINKGRIFEDYDEYNHWGVMIKNMFSYHSYGTHPESIVSFNEYPPFTSIFQYLFVQIKGVFAEDVVITAQNILYFSFIIPITSKIKDKKDLSCAILCVILIIFMPMIFYVDFYVNILVDGMLGIVFAYILYSAYRKEKNVLFQVLQIFSGLAMLVLTKTQGMGIALFAIVIIGGRLFQQRKQLATKKQIKYFMIMITILLIFLISWNIKTINQPKRWDINRIGEVNLIDVIMGKADQKVYEIIEIYTRAFFYNSQFITEKKLTAFSCVIAILALSILLYQKICKEEKEKYQYYIITLFISMIIYFISLLWMYCTIFDPSEATILTSFSRYINTMLIAGVTFLSFILMQEKETIRASTLIGIISIILLLLPINNLKLKYSDIQGYILHSNEKRENKIKLESYKEKLTINDKILYVANTNVEEGIIQLALNRYIMMPISVHAVMPGTNGNIEKFQEDLKKDGYDYVYVYRATEVAKKEYSSIFENQEMKQDTLYKVQIINNQLFLKEINK